eukprot:scaffold66_cov233-Pinguiococcus_pyrenoidosus.AAC.3
MTTLPPEPSAPVEEPEEAEQPTAAAAAAAANPFDDAEAGASNPFDEDGPLEDVVISPPAQEPPAAELDAAFEAPEGSDAGVDFDDVFKPDVEQFEQHPADQVAEPEPELMDFADGAVPEVGSDSPAAAPWETEPDFLGSQPVDMYEGPPPEPVDANPFDDYVFVNEVPAETPAGEPDAEQEK